MLYFQAGMQAILHIFATSRLEHIYRYRFWWTLEKRLDKKLQKHIALLPVSNYFDHMEITFGIHKKKTLYQKQGK